MQVSRPEMAVVYDVFHRTESNAFDVSPDSSGDQSVTKGRINYLSLSYPFTLWQYTPNQTHMIFSLSYQKLYDFARSWDFPIEWQTQDFHVHQEAAYRQEGSLSAVGAAVGVQIRPALTAGLTVNFWNDDLTPNSWTQETIQTGSGTVDGHRFQSQVHRRDAYALKGVNANIGVLWRMYEKEDRSLTIGAVVKLPFSADLSHDYSLSEAVRYPESPQYNRYGSDSFRETIDLTMPMSYGVGLSYRFSHRFMTSVDVYRTEWDDFILKTSAGEKSPITGKPAHESDISPTHQIRMGMEYLHIADRFIIPICAGVFYDPAPARGSPDDIYGVSFGTGVGVGRVHIDIAWQYRFGYSVGSSVLENWGFSQDLREHTVYWGVVVHF
jgi:long-subunit fatty acid transport protein